MTARIKSGIAFLLNLLSVIFVVISIVGFFTVGAGGNMSGIGFVCFRYFTIDSNVLLALTSLPLLYTEGRAFVTGKDETKAYLLKAKFVGTVAVTVTFLTVMFFLGPTMGYLPMLVGSNLYLHLLCPLFALIGFLFFEGEKLPKKQYVLGALPTFIYGLLYVFMVLILTEARGGWEDFYGFARGGFWYISVIVMFSASYGLSVLIAVLHNRFTEKE